MPIEIIAGNPRVLCLPAAGFGILVRLAFHYWATECRSLPKQGDDLFSIARAQRPTWATWREEIFGILGEVLPQLERDYRAQAQRRNALAALGVKGASVLALRAAERRELRTMLKPDAPTRPVRDERSRRPEPVSADGFSEASR